MLKKHIPLRINFRPKKQVKGNNAFIYCRIKLNGVDATDFSTHIRHTDHWDQASQHFNCKEYQFENDQLSEIIDDIKLIYKELKRSKDDITAHHLRNTYCRRSEKRTLLNCYDHHLTVFSKRMGSRGYNRGTRKGHKSMDRIIRNYLTYLKRKDIDLLEIRLAFGKGFVSYLKDEKHYSQNYIVRNISHLKRILDQAQADGYLSANPLSQLNEEREEPGQILFYTEHELALMTDNPLLTNHLERVVDATLFQCYTGLAYCDLKRFDARKHIVQLQGRDIIQFTRQKGDAPFTIPVLPQAQRLLNKYTGQIPIISNQKMNEYLFF